jgi:hypothetical protein
MNKKEKPNKEEIKNAQGEAKDFLKEADGKKPHLPNKDKNILDWNANELKTYMISMTAGMSPSKKIKFAQETLKRINDEKKKRKDLTKK